MSGETDMIRSFFRYPMSLISDLFKSSLVKLELESSSEDIKPGEEYLEKHEKKKKQKQKDSDETHYTESSFDTSATKDVELEGSKKKKKKKKSKDVSKDLDQQERDESIVTDERFDTSDIKDVDLDEDHKKKKKKKKSKAASLDLEHVETMNVELDRLKEKKKKKKKKHRHREDASPSSNTISSSSMMVDDNLNDKVLGKVELDTQVDGKRKFDSFNESFPLSAITNIPENGKTPKRIKKSYEDLNYEVSMKDVSNVASFIKGTPSLSKGKTLVSDIYLAPSANIIKGDLLSTVQYILDQNVPVSKLNEFWTRNHMPSTEIEAKKLREKYNAVFHRFTNEEDAMILQRFRQLTSIPVIHDIKSFVEDLNKQNGRKVTKLQADKSVRNIVGLYVGQDIPYRLAHELTQRLIYLLDGSSLMAKYSTRTPLKSEEPTYKIKSKIPIPWSLHEDKVLIQEVLRKNMDEGYIFNAIENVVDCDINWNSVEEALKEYGRSRQNARERWNRTVKVMLLEGDQDPMERFEYEQSLLELILKMNVKDRKEIRWKDIACNFPKKTSSALSQDFWSLIRKKKEDTLAGKIQAALVRLEKPSTFSLTMSNKKSERRSILCEFYKDLISDFTSL